MMFYNLGRKRFEKEKKKKARQENKEGEKIFLTYLFGDHHFKTTLQSAKFAFRGGRG